MKYLASANQDTETRIAALVKKRDVYQSGSPQWCIYDAAIDLARLAAQQWEDA